MNSHLYILQCEHYFKIGFTTQTVEKRVKALETGNPFPIKIVVDAEFCDENFAERIEALYHRKFEDRRVSGEWFVLESKHIDLMLSELKEFAKLLKLKVVNKPVIKYNDNKNNYWKYRYLIVHKNMEDMRKDKFSRDLSFESCMRFKEQVIRKKIKEIDRLKGLNKDLRKEVKEVSKLTEEHTFNQIIEQLNFIKNAL